MKTTVKSRIKQRDGCEKVKRVGVKKRRCRLSAFH